MNGVNWRCLILGFLDPDSAFGLSECGLIALIFNKLLIVLIYCLCMLHATVGVMGNGCN